MATNVPMLQEWRVEKKIERGLPLVSADESALARVLRNLLDNAVKYGDGAERCLKIEAYKIADAQKNEVIIIVADDGEGISARICRTFSSRFIADEKPFAPKSTATVWD